MKELDIRILEVENGYTLEISYTDNNGDYQSKSYIAHVLADVLHKIDEIVV